MLTCVVDACIDKNGLELLTSTGCKVGATLSHWKTSVSLLLFFNVKFTEEY